MKQTNESAFVEAEKKRLSRRSNCRAKRPKLHRYPPEFRLRALRMCTDEGHPQAEVARLLTYLRNGGADASLFRSSEPPRGGSEERPRLPEPVRDQIVALKQANQGWGVRRIAQVLRRWFLMQASPETVRRHEIFDWICAHAQTMVETKWEMSDHHARALAWRRSVVAWLRCQHLITVSRKPQPSPLFKTQIRS